MILKFETQIIRTAPTFPNDVILAVVQWWPLGTQQLCVTQEMEGYGQDLRWYNDITSEWQCAVCNTTIEAS